jgi:putative selenium metabolism protein SsnA
VYEDGWLKLDGDKIADIGSGQPKLSASDEVIDARGRLVMPGLVNPHMHLYSQFAMGLAVPKMANFGEILEGLWWRLDKALTPKGVYLSGKLGLLKAIKSGVTTVIDHHASYSCTRGSLGELAKAFKETGVRGVLCYEVSDRNGKDACREAIEENISFIKSCGGSKVLQGMFGLHASFTLSDEALGEVRKANEKTKAPYHIHVAEGEEDAVITRSRYKASVVKRLFENGILREGTIAAHCIHVDDSDIAALKKSKAFVVHNPMSNMNNAVGRAPYLKMCAAGVNVGIGTDGMSAGIFGDVKAASVMHKEAVSDPQAGWCEVQRSTLNVNPQIAGRLLGCKLGMLEKGAGSDVIVVDMKPFTPVTPENYWAHILFGVANARVRTTIASGRVLMKDFVLMGVDEDEVVKEAKAEALKTWKKF